VDAWNILDNRLCQARKARRDGMEKGGDMRPLPRWVKSTICPRVFARKKGLAGGGSRCAEGASGLSAETSKAVIGAAFVLPGAASGERIRPRNILAKG